MIGEDDLRTYLDKFDKKYWATYKVLDILQKVFYRSVPSGCCFVGVMPVWQLFPWDDVPPDCCCISWCFNHYYTKSVEGATRQF